jgi:RND family efflux transporter MFP subunit
MHVCSRILEGQTGADQIVQEDVTSNGPVRWPALSLWLAVAALSFTPACRRTTGLAPPVALDRPRPASLASTQEYRPDPGFVGVVVAGEWTDLEPRVEGRIQALLVKPGDRVEAGTVVARLDDQTTEIELGAARAAWREARGRYLRRRKLARRNVGVVAQEELDSIHKEMLEARARMARLQRAREEATVAAPFGGSVIEAYLAAGALAGPGRPVVRLAARSEPRVRFAVPQESGDLLLLEAPLIVELARPHASLRARVSGVSPDVDDASGMIFATATLERSGPVGHLHPLATGMLARVFLAGAR